MTDQLRKSVQRAKFEAHINEGEGTKGHRRGVQYTRLDGEAPKAGSKAVKLVSQFTMEEAALIKWLKPGDEFVVEKVESKWTAPDGKEASSWNLSTVRDISTWVEPAPKKPWDGGKSNWKGGSGSKSSGYDNLGQQIGNSLTNAIVSLGSGHTVEEYKQRCLELVKAGDWVREQIEKKVSSPISVAVRNDPKPSSSSTSTQSEANSHSSDDDFFADLGNVPFG